MITVAGLDPRIVILLGAGALLFGIVLADSMAAAVAVLLLLAPIHDLPGSSPEQLRLVKQLMTVATIAVWMLRMSAGQYRHLVRNPMLYATVPYSALLLVSSLLSGAVAESLQAAGADIALLALLLCVSDIAVDESGRSLIVGAALVSVSAGSAVLLLQAVLASSTFQVVQSFSMLELPLPLAFALLTAPNASHRWVWLGPVAVASTAVLLASHRGTVLAAAAATVVVALYRWRWRLLPFAAVAIAMAGLLMRAPLLSYFRTGAGLTGRPELWTAAVRIFLDHPFTGTGPGSFSRVYQAYQPSLLELPIQSRPIGDLPHAHNILLNALAELGFLGPLTVAVLLGSALWLAYRVWREQPEGSAAASLALGLLATVAAVSVQELTESGTVFRNGSQNIFFWIFVGVTAAMWRGRRSPAAAAAFASIRRPLRWEG